MRNRKQFDAAPAEGAPSNLVERLGYIDANAVSTDLLRVAVKTGQNRHSLGDFPPVYKIGNRRVCRIDEVDKWIRTRRVTRG